jgi:hypothetical protein
MFNTPCLEKLFRNASRKAGGARQTTVASTKRIFWLLLVPDARVSKLARFLSYFDSLLLLDDQPLTAVMLYNCPLPLLCLPNRFLQRRRNHSLSPRPSLLLRLHLYTTLERKMYRLLSTKEVLFSSCRVPASLGETLQLRKYNQYNLLRMSCLPSIQLLAQHYQQRDGKRGSDPMPLKPCSLERLVAYA